MKKSTKILIILGISILLIGLVTTAYILLTTPDKNTTLTALEKRWIEQNKNNKINVAVLNNIPIYGYEGEGVFFDYIKDFEKDIDLKFNRVSYNYGDTPSLYDYKFEIVDNVDDNQILFYQDHYVAVSKGKSKINDINNLKEFKIGTLDRKISDVSYFMSSDDYNIETRGDIDALITDFDEEIIDMIIIPYTMYLDKMLESNYEIVYNFSDIIDNYVLTLNNDNTTVNNVLVKYFDLWKNSKYQDSYNSKFTKLYFTTKEISTKKQADFKGKVYHYGYVENLPFESVINNTLVGINGEYIKRFSELTGVEIEYKKYNSISNLKDGFNSGEVDIVFNNFSNELSSGILTPSIFDEEFVVLSHVNKPIIMDSIKSLKNKTVHMIKGSLLTSYIKGNSNTDIVTYKRATGFEALFGYLYLNNKYDRILELVEFVMEV